MTPIADPIFYALAVPAVFLVGLSKGGFGGSIALLGVPMMSLAISPVQAAGIMLPILVTMDIVGLVAYRGKFDKASLKILLPGAVIGIAIGYFTAAFVTEAHVRLIVGLVALLFSLNYYLGRANRGEARPHKPWRGRFWGVVAGFTSFVSHTGGPPFQMYMLPLRLNPVLFAGTAIIFFSTVNAIKLVPYFLLGQFDATNLATSAVLLPIAPVATLFGVWLVHYVKAETFYRVTYAMVLAISFKLIWDGLGAFLK
ncbi:sulfite exporter TauE/SafE family protein [Rhizobiales bacterium]|uniref:sulfite exporter TauE/SafE family protein n=1 Tax=Hongsoonwoonella zoysiae TaxID=2821844 RepID=UPI00155F69D9|nr:sulfite exporter TauE/SafE family protein [Hongsoonwoonella zoysiae]NRG17346.1 sulfite exporter TauE/SafE family protein [Hongsoonwoonella zoysiae]